MPAEAFFPNHVNSSPASPLGWVAFKWQLLSERFFSPTPLIISCSQRGGRKSQDISDIKGFQASYLILVDEEEHDEQNLQEEDKQEQDEELWDTKEGKFNTAFIREEEETAGDDGHLWKMCEVQIEERVLRLYIMEW